MELVDRLVKKGLIQRTRSEQDRREVHLKVTPHGEQLLRELTLHTRAELLSTAPGLIAALQKVMSRKPDIRSRRMSVRPGRKRA